MLNIKSILNCARECNNLFAKELEYLQLKLFVRKINEIILSQDQLDSDISEHFDNAIKFLVEAKNKNSNVLVHCQLGKSRSVSIVIAYLIKVNRMTYEEAYKFVKEKRKVAFPNLGFVRQLREFNKQLRLEINPDYISNKSTK